MRLEGYSPWGCKRVGHDLATEQQNLFLHPSHTIQALESDIQREVSQKQKKQVSYINAYI